jgi:hypothetical protein
MASGVIMKFYSSFMYYINIYEARLTIYQA